MLSGKKILIGITGSIAAYKAIYLVRLLVKAGAEVKVIMTPQPDCRRLRFPRFPKILFWIIYSKSNPGQIT